MSSVTSALSKASMPFAQWLHGKRASLPVRSIQAVSSLKAEGATLPFIARYRKEAVGNLDEVAIWDIMESEKEWNAMEKRRQFILTEIETQNKLTDSLRQLIVDAQDTTLLEDLYLPYKQKRATKASKARDAGLSPYAGALWDMAHGCKNSKTEEYGSRTSVKALQSIFRPTTKPPMAGHDMNEGAMNILSQQVAEDQQVRAKVRAHSI
jgi:uncharacterized protein